MAVIRALAVAGRLSADMATGTTTMSSAGLADLPVVASPDIAKVVLYQTDTTGRVTKKEVLYITAHSSSATSATVSRAQEGTSAQNWNGTTTPDAWVHAPTAVDFTPYAVVSKTAAYTAAPGELVLANTTGGAFAITLPTGAAVGSVITVSKSDSSANLLSVKPPTSKALNNMTSIGLSAAYWSLTCTHVGSDNWIVTSAIGTPKLWNPTLSVVQSATYGDDFTGSGLDAKWSRVGFTSGEEAYQQDGGETLVWTGSRGTNTYYYQSAPGSDFEVIWSGKATVSGSTMFGALILDASGTGVGAILYNGTPDAPLVVSVASGVYSSSFQQTGGLLGSTFYGGTTQAWIRLKKISTTYEMAVSTDGNTWGSFTPTITWAGTPARIGFGCVLGTITTIRSDVFDVR